MKEGQFWIVFLHCAKIEYPGHQSAIFLILYDIFRFNAEFFRKPDPQIGCLLKYFMLGQFLCIIIDVSGVIAILRTV